MEHFLLQLLKASLTGGGVILVLLLLRPLLRRRFAAKAYYWVWLVLAAALLPWPSYPVHGPVQIEAPEEQVIVWAADDPAPKLAPQGEVVPPETAYLLPTVLPEQFQLVERSPVPARRALPLSTVLFWLWVAGTAVYLGVQWVGYHRFRRLTRRWSEGIKNQRYPLILREEAERVGVKPPRLRLCPAVPTPALTGLLRPTLLLPHEAYGEEELRFILRHELTHRKRRDILYKLALTLVNAIHWFNPLVYGMLRAADEDIELSCDSAVTAQMGQEERALYSETLLKAVASKGGAVPLTTCFGGTVRRLKRRLSNILDSGKKRRGVVIIALVILAVVGLSAAFTVVRTGAAGEPSGDEAPQSGEEAGAADAPSTDEPAPVTAQTLFEEVLRSETPLYYTDRARSDPDQAYVYLSELTEEDGTTMDTAWFAVVDLDGDGGPEVVYQRSDYRGFVVLRYYQGSIYGYEMNYRAMMDLKQDGSFMGSGGADNPSFGKLRFLGEACDVDGEEYIIRETASRLWGWIDQEGFEQLWADFDALPDVVWHPYTEDAIQMWIPHSFAALNAPEFPEPTAMQDYLDSLSGLLYFNFEDSANPYPLYCAAWDQAMEDIYGLCLEASGSDAQALEADQAQWLEKRAYWEADSSHRLGEMIKQRTYQLISLYFGDHFYD